MHGSRARCSTLALQQAVLRRMLLAQTAHVKRSSSAPPSENSPHASHQKPCSQQPS